MAMTETFVNYDPKTEPVEVQVKDVVIGQYADWTPETPLQPGCLVCAGTIPEPSAKRRAVVCSDACRYAYRKWRRMTPAERAAAARLHCLVCRGEIPHRANVTWAETCSTDCRNAIRRYRFQIVQNQKCPHCLHPNSDEERELFRQWRASQGPMQGFYKAAHGRGNLAWKREKQLQEALGEAVEALTAVRDEFLVECDARKMEGLSYGEETGLRFKDGLKLVEMEQRLERFAALLAMPFGRPKVERKRKRARKAG